jgi:hypothetical protein
VAADFAANNVPLVVSPDITWVADMFQADPNSMWDIVKKMHHAWSGKKIGLHHINGCRLDDYNRKAIKEWLDFIGSKSDQGGQNDDEINTSHTYLDR